MFGNEAEQRTHAEHINSFDLSDDDSWTYEMPRYALRTHSQWQWWAPDDATTCARTNPRNGDPPEIFGFWSVGPGGESLKIQYAKYPQRVAGPVAAG